MRTDTTTNQKLRSSFARIRGDVRKMQKKIDSMIYDYAVQNEANSKIYNREHLKVVQAEMTAKCSADSAKLKAETKQKCRAEVGAIRTTLQDWTLEPIPSKTSTLLESYLKYGLMPTESELKIIAESTSGSYIGQRILEELASRSGFVLSDFTSIETINRMLTNLEHDVCVAIDAYNGQLTDDYKYVADLLDMHLANDNLKDWYVFSERFVDNNEDTSFNRLEKLLCDLTDTDIKLSTSKRNELEKLLDTETHDEKISIACTIIEGDSVLSSALRLYDEKLYNEACQHLADEAHRRMIEAAEQSVNAFHDMQTAQRAERVAERRLA